MAPRFWVPLTHAWLERNWKRASSGWSRTAPMVANRVSTSTPLRRWVGFSVTDMWVPLEWWCDGSGDGRGAQGCGLGGEVDRLALEGIGELDLQLDEPLGAGKGGQCPGEGEGLAQCEVTAGLVGSQRLVGAGRAAQRDVERIGQQLSVAEGIGDAVPGDRVAVVAGVGDESPGGTRAADRATQHVRQVDRAAHPCPGL